MTVNISLHLPEFMEVRALDGRFITLVSAQTQTDWEWVEQSLSFSCQVQKEIEDPQLLQEEVIPEDEHDIPHVGLPRLIAYKPEPKQTLQVEKVPEVESKQDVYLVQCDYCQQLCQPFVHSELLESETDFERLLCCEQARQMRKIILEERGKLAEKESNRKIDVDPHDPVLSEEERKAAREKAREKLKHLQRKEKTDKNQKKPTKDNLKKDSGQIEIKHKFAFRLSKEIPDTSDEAHSPSLDIKNTTSMFTFQEETNSELKPMEVTKKFYENGTRFLTLCPDRTGNVFYPSGKLAIIISSAKAADFTYIILEDKDTAPRIKGIFTNKGHATCYHPNGKIWVNLTPVGGLWFDETGALKRRWSWLDLDSHVRKLPFKPVTFALGPHISVRIHSQECMYITFAHHQHNMRFSVGSKLKLICPESHEKKLGKDNVERYIQMKTSEIHSLLGQMQTCMSHHSADPHNIKPH